MLRSLLYRVMAFGGIFALVRSGLVSDLKSLLTLTSTLGVLLVACIFIGATIRVVREWRLEAQKRERRRLRLPSPSQWLVGAATRRLPKEMDPARRKRWAKEMGADVANLPRRSRLLYAFNIWRKGAPEMPVGRDDTLSPAGREASPVPPDDPAAEDEPSLSQVEPAPRSG